ncbi:uncharacterized protein B0I36DRAFT_336924 [Microdochium trichocladiopsis]|uniref:Secreted protein n=1 Tax=Microdochium trichocladiopsis TaxID=1682393 RepID=A0A9P8XSX1_9PEZI|nr:uncharacterized protein B0I36DRAFT_336924 [Microdochium trichocladiopsis]KAH7016156.1 hypothetical protein B0I36DRAFT_336924 [Microdochium trichocladiopsis]
MLTVLLILVVSAVAGSSAEAESPPPSTLPAIRITALFPNLLDSDDSGQKATKNGSNPTCMVLTRLCHDANFKKQKQQVVYKALSWDAKRRLLQSTSV